MAHCLIALHLFAVVASFRAERIADDSASHGSVIHKHEGGQTARGSPIQCNMDKKLPGPLKWGADFSKMPLGVNGNGDTVFMGRKNEDVYGNFTDDAGPAGKGKMLMRLEEVCCGGEEVEEQYGHHAAEGHWYYQKTLEGFEAELREAYAKGQKLVFRCSVCGAPLFVLDPAVRALDDFLKESVDHGWPSFRDTDLFIEDHHPNLDSYDLTRNSFGRAYSDDQLKDALKAMISRGSGSETPDFIKEWKSKMDTPGPFKLWQRQHEHGGDFEVHCSNCGAHVGHANPNAPPDAKGNRYCIDAGCIASSR